MPFVWQLVYPQTSVEPTDLRSWASGPRRSKLAGVLFHDLCYGGDCASHDGACASHPLINKAVRPRPIQIDGILDTDNDSGRVVHQVWALAVGGGEALLATGAADATVALWEDCTAADQEEAALEQESVVLKQQHLSNALHVHFPPPDIFVSALQLHVCPVPTFVTASVNDQTVHGDILCPPLSGWFVFDTHVSA